MGLKSPRTTHSWLAPAYDLIGQRYVTAIANAAVKTLHATPVQVAPAPGAGKYIYVRSWAARYVFATAAFDGVASNEELTLRYTDGSGGEAAPKIPAVGFADQATDQLRVIDGGQITAGTPVTPVANAPLVVFVNTGEWFAAAGGGSLIVEVDYHIRLATPVA